MKSAEKLIDIERKMREKLCPICGKSKFDVALHCVTTDHECIYTATCQNCTHRFQVSNAERWDGI